MVSTQGYWTNEEHVPESVLIEDEDRTLCYEMFSLCI